MKPTKWYARNSAAAAIATASMLAAIARPASSQPADLFVTADRCRACHNKLGLHNGTDLSIGLAWQGTMMAHSAVDPYWRAAVRREVTDHPAAAAAIEDECSKCHMPMQRFVDRELGGNGRVLSDPAQQPDAAATADDPLTPLAIDGVSCAMCHQIQAENLGSEESFVGGFEVDTSTPIGKRRIYGPYAVVQTTKRVMRSATGFEPSQSSGHMQSAEFCATCHTLYTHTRDDEGKAIGEFPEQVPRRHA